MGVENSESGAGMMDDVLPLITATQGDGLTKLVNVLYSKVKATSPSERYEQIPVQNLLRNNGQTSEGLTSLRVGLKCLERYCRNLVPAEPDRHQHWRTIMTSNLAFTNKIKPVQGATEVLMTLGYTEVKSDRILFPEDRSITPEETKKLLTELVMSHYEIELYLTGKHPNSAWMDQRLPTHVRIPQNVLIDEVPQVLQSQPESLTEQQIQQPPDEAASLPSLDEKPSPGVSQLKNKFENQAAKASEPQGVKQHVKKIERKVPVKSERPPVAPRPSVARRVVPQKDTRPKHHAKIVKPVVPAKYRKPSGSSANRSEAPKVTPGQRTAEPQAASEEASGGPSTLTAPPVSEAAPSGGGDQAQAEAMDTESGDEEGTCYVCGTYSKGVWYCKDCAETLCDDCNRVYHKHHDRISHQRLKRRVRPEQTNEQPQEKRQTDPTLFTSSGSIAHLQPGLISTATMSNISPVLVPSFSSSGPVPDLGFSSTWSSGSNFSMPPPPGTQNDSVSAHNLESDETTANRRIEKQQEQITLNLNEISEKERYYDNVMMRVVSSDKNFQMNKEYIDARNKRNEMTKLRQELEEKKVKLTMSNSGSGDLLAGAGASSSGITLCKCGVYSKEGYCMVCREKDGQLAKAPGVTETPSGDAAAAPVIAPIKKPWKCSNCLHLNSAQSIKCESCIQPQSDSLPANKVCPFFNRPTGCRFGDRCHFQHVQGVREPCYFFQQPAGCKKGEDCPFLHEKLPANQESSSSDAAVDVDGVQLDFGKVSMTSDAPSGVTGQAIHQIQNQQQAALNDIRKFSAEKEQEDSFMRNMKLILLLRTTERSGYTFEELDYAMSMVDSVDPLSWLNDTWKAMVDGLVQSTGLPPDEIKQSLLINRLDINAATKQARDVWDAKVKSVQTEGSFTEAQVGDALKTSNGDVEAALHTLTSNMLSDLHDNIHIELSKVTAPPAVSASSDVYYIDPETEVVMRTDADRQRRIRIALIEGELQGWLRAENMIKLIDELDNMENIDISDILSSVRQFGALDKCKKWLQFQCPFCIEYYPEYKMHTMFLCDDKFCQNCLIQHYTLTIKEKDVNDFGCPQCKLPNFYSTDQQERETMHTYLQMFDAQMRIWLPRDVFEMYQMKVTQWHLQQDATFRWCSYPECQFGFLYDGLNKKMTCPKCHQASCSECKKPWEPAHDGISCDQFAQWQIDNDPKFQEAGIIKILEESGINCPNCKFRYQLAKGGCMHFTCIRCRYEFCSGCRRQIVRDAAAGLSAPHPRDCLYYLRDYPVETLLPLLQNNDIDFKRNQPEGVNQQTCQVMEQKEIGLQEEACGKQVQQNQAGLCDLHYREYIVSLINRHRIDPVTIMEVHRVKVECRSHNINVPEKTAAEADAAYLTKIRQLLQNGAPLPPQMY